MLQLTAKVLGTTSENVNGPNGSFVSETIHLLEGVEKYEVRVGRDFPRAEMPKDGETVTLGVVVSAFATRGGAGYRLTALSRVATGGARLAATGS